MSELSKKDLAKEVDRILEALLFGKKKDGDEEQEPEEEKKSAAKGKWFAKKEKK